ncbi:MAG: SigE family RNA polymerase sigma factor [Micromonosporaceae bacterium]|nr:SigE family RNA polymerase sigma factor [Micromonosporaceae bacterium]
MQAAEEQEYVDYVTARLPALRRLAFLLCGEEHHADDLVQQTMTTLYLRWQRIRAVEHLDQYVRTMLTNAFITERRRRWAKVLLFRDAPEPRTPQPAMDSQIDEHAAVRSALAQVPRRQRAALVLRFMCDLPVAEVAAVLGCSEGTVKSQTSRGLTTLRRLLSEQQERATAGETR